MSEPHTFTRASSGADSILPDEFGALIIKPLQRLSLAFDPVLASVHSTNSRTWRVPVVLSDPLASWLNEGQEIEATTPELGEVEVQPAKVGGLTIITSELANDSSPAAHQIVGDGLARDIARRVDEAFCGSLTSPAPAGLESVDGVHQITGELTNLDALAEAVAALEGSGYEATAFLASPADGLRLAQLKTGDGSNAPLLEDGRQVMQRPVKISPHVPEGTVWAVDASLIHTVLRSNVELAVSTDSHFTSDKVAVRALMRIGFAFPDSAAIAKISLTTE